MSNVYETALKVIATEGMEWDWGDKTDPHSAIAGAQFLIHTMAENNALKPVVLCVAGEPTFSVSILEEGYARHAIFPLLAELVDEYMEDDDQETLACLRAKAADLISYIDQQKLARPAKPG